MPELAAAIRGAWGNLVLRAAFATLGAWAALEAVGDRAARRAREADRG